MRFTPKERDAICHRLEVPAALAQALSLDPHETEWDCDRLIMTIAGGRGLILSALSPVERRILLDCVEGSTWAVSVDGEPCYYAACQTLTRLARKFEAEGLGRNIIVPT